MKNVKTSILCSILCALTACGGSSSGDKPKINSSSSLSSSSAISSSSESSQSSESSESSESSSLSSSSVSEASSSVVSSSESSASSESSSSVSSSSSESSSVESSSSTSSSSSSVNVVAQTGVFIDSAVAGVTYLASPSGFNGITSVTGQYQFAEGDTVVFSIGEIEFPTVTAKGVVTPVDMAASGDPSDPIVINIAVLLQSLDADGDPANGISIPAAAVAAASQNVNFSQPYLDFAASVLPVVQHTDSTKAVVTATAASAHLAESLAQVNASSLVGAWHIQGDTYQYALFILDESRYAAVDNDTAEANGTAFEIGSYVWNQATGIVTLSDIQKTISDLDAQPPMASGNTLKLNGNELTLIDADESFVLHRLMATPANSLRGGWSFIEEGTLVVFAYTDTHYLMGQYSEADEVGQAGAEIGTYTRNTETGEFVVTTTDDTNDQWGLSHPCAVLDLQEPNDLRCGPGGRDIVQTLIVTGDTLTFTSEADTIANDGEEQSHLLERVNGVPDGDAHLKLELTLTLTDYEQGELFTQGGTMQCDLNQPRTVGETETINESWVLGNNSGRSTWTSDRPATFNPTTNAINFERHDPVSSIPGHSGFFTESWEHFEGTYNAGEDHVITGTYTEKYSLTRSTDTSVSTCEATFSVVGVLR